MKSKFIYSIVSCLLFIVSCQPKQASSPTDIVNIPATASEGVNKEELPEIKFREEVFDFGTITQGEKVTHDFVFKNAGKNPLVIASAYADCGCTVPEVPKMPILAAEESVIKVSFDSEGKNGVITKQITLLTNCMPNKRIIKIKATIFSPQKK